LVDATDLIIEILDKSSLDTININTSGSDTLIFLKNKIIAPNKSDYIKIIEIKGGEKELKHRNSYYFIKRELVKVETFTAPPHGMITATGNYYFKKNKPIIIYKEASRHVYKDLLKKANSLLKFYPAES
jgi:hypothetical protein